MQYACKGSCIRRWPSKGIPRKPNWIAKSNDEDAFPMLGYKTLRINYLVENMIPKLILEHIHDDAIRALTVVTAKILYILEHECRGPMRVNYLRNVKEKRSLRLACKS